MLKPKTYAILQECIERGIACAIGRHEPCPVNAHQLETLLEDEIWLQIDTFFTIDNDEV